MDLSIIIVSWNVRERLRENLKQIYDSISGLSVEVFVVDNNSADQSVEMVRENFPQVRLIVNGDNRGFARANNQAIRESCGDFVLLLNPDMRVNADTLSKMVAWMRDNKQASVAGCHLVTEKGETIKHVRRFPYFLDQLAIVLKLPHFFPTILSSYIREDFDYTKVAQVDSVRGGFFMMRRDILGKISGLDERYFIWFEEVDFCKQVLDNGGEVWYTPVADCIDYVGQSFGQVKRSTTQKYFKDSMLKYFEKWHPAWQYSILKLAWLFSDIIFWVLIKMDFKGKGKT